MSRELLGLLMFPLAMLAIVFTGLPAFAVLIGTSGLFALIGLASGAFDLHLLQALPVRLVGLLEHDLLQALVLFSLVGALLQRLQLAGTWLATMSRWLAPTRAGEALALLGLGALAAPMNGSVGASLAMLKRAGAAPLAHLPPAQARVLLAVSSTLGVIVPPSLVLVLLGDAMMRAHTEALQGVNTGVRIINNQDVMRAMLLPGALLLLAWGCWTWWATRRTAPGGTLPAAAPPVTRRAAITTLALSFAVPALLAAVAAGRLYAVEAAAAAGVGLMLYGMVSGQLRGAWTALLDDAMRVTGMVFALLVGATGFTLVLRGFGTDAWLGTLLRYQASGPAAALAVTMGLLLLGAFVLDAFELVFLVVPLVMPPLLSVVPDAAWVAAIAMLALQAGFLLPPLGFALVMAQREGEAPLPARALLRALLPYLLLLLAVLAATLAWPAMAHLGRGAEPAAAATAPKLDDAAVEELMRQSAPRSGRDAP